MAPAAKALPELVALYLLHLDGGAFSARGRPYSPRTIAGYREGLAAFVRAGELLAFPEDVARLSRLDLDRYARSLRVGGAKATTVADRFNVLGPFFSWLVGRGVISRTPLDASRRPRPRSEPVEPLTRGQVQALLDGCEPGTWLGARNLAMLWVLLDTGMRAGELAALELGDLDEGDWTLRIRLGKGDKARRARLGEVSRVPVADFVVLFRGREPGPLFPSQGGRQFRRDGVSALVAGIGRAAGVLKSHPHRFRHTFAVEFLRAGGDPFRLQLLLGHTTLEMTRRYTSFLSMEDALAAHVVASPGDAMGLRRWRGR